VVSGGTLLQYSVDERTTIPRNRTMGINVEWSGGKRSVDEHCHNDTCVCGGRRQNENNTMRMSNEPVTE